MHATIWLIYFHTFHKQTELNVFMKWKPHTQWSEPILRNENYRQSHIEIIFWAILQLVYVRHHVFSASVLYQYILSKILKGSEKFSINADEKRSWNELVQRQTLRKCGVWPMLWNCPSTKNTNWRKRWVVAQFKSVLQ